jgi:hypothetical protein
MAQDPPPYAELLRRRNRPVVAMPERDDVIDAMDAVLRRKVGQTWARRAHEELKAAMAFTLLSRELLAAGAVPDVLVRVTRAVSDEVRHAEILRALASRYLGQESPWPPGMDLPPEPPGEAPWVLMSLHAVTLCCVSETIASVFIEASHAAATSPSVRASLGIVLADEVEHGRAGWAYLASVRDDRTVMAAVQRAMASMVRKAIESWFDFGAIVLPDGTPEHGLLSNEEVRACVVTALRELVLPGFSQLGLDVTEASAALSAARGTESCP